MVRLHYFFDPMCGWCYGATPLLEVLAEYKDVALVYHPGGMLADKVIEPAFRQHIIANDKHIATMTGAHFGQAYLDRIQGNEKLVLDSYLPIRAMMEAMYLKADPLALLKKMQKSHYQEGKALNQVNIASMLTSLGISGEEWQAQMEAGDSQVRLLSWINETRRMMAELGIKGFPTFVIEKEGQWQTLAHSDFYGKQNAWQEYLEALLP